MVETFTPGDVVRLKSGGPDMTVEWVDDRVRRPIARCVWADAKEALHTEFVLLAALERVDRDAAALADRSQARMASTL